MALDRNQENALNNGELSPDFMDQDEEVLFAEAKLGEEADAFFKSDVGRYVVGAAIQDMRKIQSQLLTVSPWRKRRIQQLQNQATACQLAMNWLGEAITNGDSAYQELLARRSQHHD